jgi:hypothetical protein
VHQCAGYGDGISVRARQAGTTLQRARTRRVARGPPAEAAPRGACEADACRAHAQTSTVGLSMSAHGGDAWTRARMTSRCGVPGPDALACALVGSCNAQNFQCNPIKRRLDI